ncbi:MAG: alcohol dehydrogenase catalytic domain-containing protein, partial [Rhodococcus sp. (in: high G+C Gram-positive bacteria)]
MRAVHITKLDGPDSVEIVDVEEPVDDGKSVLIDIHAAGVAFPDALLTRGLYQYKPSLPFVPGSEIAGIVRSAPEGSGFTAGDRVAALTGLSDGMASVAAVAPETVFALPDAVSLTAGAGLLFNDLTVHFALRERGRLTEGETVLVHGAAGGIGTSALRMAPVLGAARVIAVV